MTASGFTMATVAVLVDPGWKDGGRGGSILKLPLATLTLPLEPLLLE
jgi:hypothetical protein